MVLSDRSTDLSFFPVPSALITFCAGDGQPYLRTSAWVGMVCSTPPLLSLAIAAGDNPFFARWMEKGFVVNLPSAESLTAGEFLGSLARRAQDTVPPGLTLVDATIVRAPLIEECPVRIECVRGRGRARFGQWILTAEVAAVHLGDTDLKEGRLPTDIHSLKPFARRWRQHLHPGASRLETPTA